MTHKPYFFSLVVIAFIAWIPWSSYAGLRWVDVGVSGLTCSVCSRSVEMQIGKLDFVDSVYTDLQRAESRVYLRDGSAIDMRKIAKAVVDAGFSVQFLKVDLNFEDISIDADGSFDIQGQSFQLIGDKDELHSDRVLKLVDRHFLPRKEALIWKDQIKTLDSSDQNSVHAVLEES